MDCGATDTGMAKKGIGQSTIAHMASESLFVYFVMEMAFVYMRNVNTFAGIVMVVGCAKPHTALPIKI